MAETVFTSLQWRHNVRDGISNPQPHDCLLNRLFRRRSKKTSKLRASGLCAENSPVAGEFPPQMASNAENVSIWWRHHVTWPGWLINNGLWRVCFPGQEGQPSAARDTEAPGDAWASAAGKRRGCGQGTDQTPEESEKPGGGLVRALPYCHRHHVAPVEVGQRRACT